MSSKYKNSIGYDKRCYGVEPGTIDRYNEREEKVDFNIVSKKTFNTDVDNLVVDIFDIIKNCQVEMSIPLFDEQDFGYFYIYEYLKSFDIQRFL